MRPLTGACLAAGLAAIALAGSAMAQTVESGGSASMVQSLNGGAPTQLGPANDTPTRYETSLWVLKAQMAYWARRDGGQLSAKHQAEFQQALDDTNRHFHKGPYARQ